ncbi:MAG TPA: hypothetical protein VFU89_01225 [Rhabdochlamydiaceae bacterium]|nr:hypothetical protein [Rhabdochlamydiaceae bacterium]
MNPSHKHEPIPIFLTTAFRASDLQQAQPTRKQAMCKHMVDGRGYKGGDVSAVKNPNFEVPWV